MLSRMASGSKIRAYRGRGSGSPSEHPSLDSMAVETVSEKMDRDEQPDRLEAVSCAVADGRESIDDMCPLRSN